jgi:enoyl-CoA hydratase/carnithine racemase
MAVVRTRQPGSSTVVLVREGSSTISDLVLLGAGGKSAIYARLRGTLSPELPKALEVAFQSRGPDGLRDELLRDLTRQRRRPGVVALHVPPAVESLRHVQPRSPREEPTMPTSQQPPPKFETVLYEKSGPICRITLNRPEKLNAATDQLVEEVNDALFEFDADPDLQVAILSGAGRAFCSGADVQQRQLRTPEEMRRLGGPAGRRSRENGLADTVNWKPVIAAVHGYALGLGYSLSQSCDLVVAAEGTQFQIREVQRGLGGAQHWVATWFWTGSRFANEVALTGRMFTAEEALQHGMVNQVVSRAELMPAAEALAQQIIENPPLAVRANVRVMRWFVNEMQRQSKLYTQGRGLHLTEDFRESAAAFVEKRKPAFKGR